MCPGARWLIAFTDTCVLGKAAKTAVMRIGLGDGVLGQVEGCEDLRDDAFPAKNTPSSVLDSGMGMVALLQAGATVRDCLRRRRRT